MPPKHKLWRKHHKTQSNPRTKRVQSSTQNKSIVHGTIQSSIETENESSLDIPSITSTTDAFTITANDRNYIQISKQILQYEMKRKRINVPTMSEQPSLGNDETTLPALIPSDWRLVLQDSITTDSLRQGCISLFDQVNSGLKLTPIEVYNASRFLKYAEIHIQHRKTPHNELIETVFPEEWHCQRKLMSALINLICHQSETLRTVALSFFTASLSQSSKQLSPAIAATGLMSQLFENLKPHEIPINETTIEFHRHITSIVDDFLFFFTLETLPIRQSVYSQYSSAGTLTDEIIQSFCDYLQHLIAPPDSPADYHYGFSLFSKMKFYQHNITFDSETCIHPKIQQFMKEMKMNMMEFFCASLNLASTSETYNFLFGHRNEINGHSWVQIFERILLRKGNGKPWSDLGVHTFQSFLYNGPSSVRPNFWSDGTFSFEKNDKILSSEYIPSTTLCALFVPTRLHHAATILDLFQSFRRDMDTYGYVMFVCVGWFSRFFDAVTPSKLPFTSEFFSLHTELVDLMKDSLGDIQHVTSWEKDDISRSNLNEIHLSFLNQIRNYLVHLSLHPFSLVPHTYFNIVVRFFTFLFQYDDKNSLTQPFRDEMRKKMDEAALSSSSPPFILVSELVYRLTDEEKLKIVDRIVALSESDSPIDDDTTLRISTFHKEQLESVYLPDLFRKAGRTTEQYLHAFQSLLSLHHDCFDLHPINSLLTPNPNSLQPTSDEWHHIDLETIVVAIRTINDGRLSFKDSDWHLHNFALKVLPQISHFAPQLNQRQLDRLLTASVNVLIKYNFLHKSTTWRELRDRTEVFLNICRLCDQRAVALCLGRVGFFSHFVSGLLVDGPSFECEHVLEILIQRVRFSRYERGERKISRSLILSLLEEGWQDVLDFLFVKNQYSVKLVVHFLGANVNSQNM
ncbi:hypothetical protein BLNAU_16752 [Blattamonas nauphoetae]|uniref:Uncharacterized protein n=1 Tax=Blattamonas nauphoetae TaxID=2049346 RepID=A0ABQ9XAK8_9EUKA|nr:hypothetical protein BLNAU_16752 [Blattamonas nauphoetae]